MKASNSSVQGRSPLVTPCAGSSAIRSAGQGNAAGCISWSSRHGPTSPPTSSSTPTGDRKSVVQGKSVSGRVALGGRRILKKNTKQQDKLIDSIDQSHI